MQAFITALTSADNRITCLTTDLAEQFETSTNYPTFSFDFGGADTITFKRYQQAGMANGAYTVSSTKWATKITDYDLNYDFMASTAAASKTRTWSFRIISSGDLLVVDFMDNRSATSTRGQIFCLTGSTKAVSYSNASPYAAVSNTWCLSDAPTTTMTKVDRMPYQYNMANANQLEIISNKVIAYSGGGIRMMTLDNLLDVSTVRASRIVSFENKTYYSLDNHTLVEI